VRWRLLIVLAASVAIVTGVAVGHRGEDAPPRPPVVVVVFDEFPVDALMLPDGRIDADRFPNFAALAGTSTWFRGAHTVYDSTFRAVPAILDAQLPKRGTNTDARDHSPSVFHLMDRLGYRAVSVESASAVCPPTICPKAPTRRPGIITRLRGGERAAELERWIDSIDPGSDPTFYFHHALLPHEYWIYLPSGHQSRPAGDDPISGLNKVRYFDEPEVTDHNHLRHLLQVGFVDRELGRLMRQLRRTHSFGRALIVVTADHGYSFELGAPSRRQVTDTNIHEIAPVPLFVKAPGQTAGRVDDSLVRTTDVVPTIADVLGTTVFWDHPGRSAFDPAVRDRTLVAMPRRDFSRVVSISRMELERRRAQARRWRAGKFGTGAQSIRAFGDPWASAYRIGPHQELLGRRVGALRVARASGLRASVVNSEMFAKVDLDAKILPTVLEGRIAGAPRRATRDLAVAVNGRIRAMGRSFRGPRRELFSLIVPESALRSGRNRVELFEVRADGRLVSLGVAR
jgi:hypothetical protein